MKYTHLSLNPPRDTLARPCLKLHLINLGYANALKLSQNREIYAVIVDAIDEQAKKFYKKCRFLEYLDTPFSLFIQIIKIKQAANW